MADMIGGLLVDAADARAEFASQRFALLPGLLTAEAVGLLLASTEGVEEMRVHCAPEVDHDWGEQQFGPGTAAYAFFQRPSVLELMRRLTGLRRVDELQCWTSIYRPGEYIGPHTDKAGTIQLLVCLQAPLTTLRGGWVFLDNIGVFLNAGDAVAFEATTVEHYTTPPLETRIVLVGRFFMS
jgi:hypothetical protein